MMPCLCLWCGSLGLSTLGWTRPSKTLEAETTARFCGVIKVEPIASLWLWWPHRGLRTGPEQPLRHMSILSFLCQWSRKFWNTSIRNPIVYTLVTSLIVFFLNARIMSRMQASVSHVAAGPRQPASNCLKGRNWDSELLDYEEELEDVPWPMPSAEDADSSGAATAAGCSGSFGRSYNSGTSA